MSEDLHKLFTDEELQRLILARVAGDHPEPVHRDAIARFISWCKQVRVDAAIVDAVLSGGVSVTEDADGEMRFHILEPGDLAARTQ